MHSSNKINSLENSFIPINQGHLQEIEKNPVTPPYFDYMTGCRAEQFRALKARGILDTEGNCTLKWKNFKLPPLLPSEISIVKREFIKKFTWKIDEETELELSIGFLVRLISKKYPITSKHLIGGFVTDLLMSKTNYAERLFAELGASDLYKRNSFPHDDCDPADIDLRLHILNSTQAPFETIDFLHIQTYLAQCLTERYFFANPDISAEEKNIVYNKIVNYFLQRPAIVSGMNRFLETSFKESSVDLILFSTLSRSHVFTLDALYLPVEPLFENKSDEEITPESHGDPLESFLHVYLGMIKAKKRSKIDVKGWFRYIGALTKGNYSAQKGSVSISLEQQLFHIMHSMWSIYGREQGNIKLRLEMGKWIKKHYEKNPEAAFAFILTASHYLESYLDFDEIKLITESHLAAIILDNNTPKQIQLALSLLQEDQLPISIILSLFQLAGFLNASREGTPFTIVSQDFQRPALQCVLNKRNIQLRLAPEKALTNLLIFCNRQKEIFDNVEKKLSELFFSLYDLSKGYSLPSQSLIDSLLSDDLLSLGTIRNTLPLLETESLFLKHTALLLITHLPFFDQRARACLAAKHFHEMLPLLEDKEPANSYYAEMLGMDIIPSLDSPTFMEEWIKALFANSDFHGASYILWKSALQKNEIPLEFSLNLIDSFCTLHPSLTTQMFSYLKQQQLLDTSSDVIALRLANWVQVSGISHEHQRFRELVQEDFDKISPPKSAPSLVGSPEDASEFVLPSLIDDFENLDLNAHDTIASPTKGLSLVESHVNALPSLIDDSESYDSNINSTADTASKLLREFRKGKIKTNDLVEKLISTLENPNINFHIDLKKEILNVLIKLLCQKSIKLSKRKKQTVNSLLASNYTLLPRGKPRRRLLKLCEARGFSIGTKAGEFWIDTLQVWMTQSPDQVKNIHRLFKHGEKQGLFESSSDLAIAFQLDLVGSVDETNPLKFSLLVNLIEICSDLEDIQILIDYLVKLIEEKTALVAKFQIIDKFLAKHPTMLRGLAAPMLEALGYLQTSNAVEDLEEIFALISFQDTTWEKREQLQTIIAFTVTSLVGREDQTLSKIEALNDLIEIYFEDLIGIGGGFWVAYLKYLIYSEIQLAIDPFVRIFNANLLEKFPYELQYTYYNLLFELYENDCQIELSFFADNYSHYHEKIFANIYDPFLSFGAHCFIIRAICRRLINRLREQDFSVQFAENLVLTRQAFQSNTLANSYLESSILPNTAYQEEQKRDCLVVKEEIDILLVELQFRTKHPHFIKDGCATLRCLLEAKKSQIVMCTANDPWPLAEALCVEMKPQPLEELDLLLPRLSDFSASSINYLSVCLFLLKHPTIDRLHHAIDLWHASAELLDFLEKEKNVSSQRSLVEEWTVFLQIINAIFATKNSELMEKVRSVLQTISKNKNEVFSCLNEEAKSQYSAVVLGKLSTILKPEYKTLFEMIGYEVMTMTTCLKNGNASQEVMDALPHGIAATAIYNYEAFLNFAGTFQLIFSTRSRIKGKITFPKMKRFTLRKQLLEAILELASNYLPLKEKLLKYVKENIKILLSEFMGEEFKAGNMELFKKIRSLETTKN